MKDAMPELRRHLEPQQLAVGTPFGCEALRWGLQAHMEQHPDHVCITIDAKNAFNAFDRARAMQVLFEVIGNGSISDSGQEWGAAAKTLVKIFHTFCLPRTKIYATRADGSMDHFCDGDEGGPQGAPSTSVAFAMLLHPVLKRFDAMDGVMVRAIADDITICMRLDENTAEFCREVKSVCGCDVVPEKCKYYAQPSLAQRANELLPR